MQITVAHGKGAKERTVRFTQTLERASGSTGIQYADVLAVPGKETGQDLRRHLDSQSDQVPRVGRPASRTNVTLT